MLSYANNKSEISLHICAVFVARRLTNSKFYFEEQIGFTNIPSHHQSSHISGADPGFLEMGFICINVRGFALLVLISHENEIIWSH